MRLLKGLMIELRPLPVIAILLSVYLAFLHAGVPLSAPILLYLLGAFFLLYTVHLLDTYEDSYVRKEDGFKAFTFAHGSNDLKKEELLAGALISSLIFFAIILSLQGGVPFLLLNLAGYLLGISYSRYLSRNVLLSLLATPTGVALAMIGVYMLATGGAGLGILAFSAPFFLLFLGASAWMDMADSDTDRRTGKPNLYLSLGAGPAKSLGLASLLGGLVATAISYPSLQYLLPLAALSLVFCRGFLLKPRKGIYYVMAGVFLYLLVRLYLAAK